ncbi:carotenoid oxygenase [Dothidotthia symphoricarpi CBS 119687]|uniref:Carotenoid oxygenase n=1 Tax=Dothidotthia symphoricarpi CBS 119687 TaxID=1392245 RepID=A0A6A6ANA6_9PLEO|nr:carotenoid oxygenase [Dothidotthia symphoricarpi CBS 119687]KAF2131971.1 carotenoid oxygenase [Dothidotthia symphoricarpi CBS 119687]
MSTPKRSRDGASKHPYLTGNFAPVAKTWPPTPVTWTGDLPEELHGGMYVRNGGNPVTNSDLGREAHWFDGDGMLSGVWFERSPIGTNKPVVHFVNQFILTDVYLSAVENSSLRTPILPSIATLVNPISSLIFIVWRILRSVFIVLLSRLPGSQYAIKRISVANTSVLYHDGRALAACESGPPIRVTLPELETVGWFDGIRAEGEPSPRMPHGKQQPGLGGSGPLSWIREWTTGHPKVDPVTGEMILFHCSFIPPYVHYSLIPTTATKTITPVPESTRLLNAPVPGCSGGKLMHDFGVSRHHTVILDLPLTLSPLNLAKNRPVVSYEPKKPARFGVFPRHCPQAVRWFETSGCCIFHTANTWDELDSEGNTVAVNLLACRLTSASLVFSAGNIAPPPHPNSENPTRRKPVPLLTRYDRVGATQDLEKGPVDETSPLLGQVHSPVGDGEASMSTSIPMTHDDQEQCRLYYYRFPLNSMASNTISHQFALSAIPFEFPAVSPFTDMDHARYVYGCSTSVESFGAALGKATKIDVIVRMDVKALLARAQTSKPEEITGCVDNRTIQQILASRDPTDSIKAFELPPRHFAQEARFVPRVRHDSEVLEEEGYLLFYVFDENQLDEQGECRVGAKSELWVLDASTMDRVVCKIQLPTRIPYGLHGNWFTEEQIRRQRGFESVRTVTKTSHETGQSRGKQKLISLLG